MYEPFNLRMERNRYKRPVSQEQLAQALRWTRTTIIDIEAGRVELPVDSRAMVREVIRRLAEESE